MNRKTVLIVVGVAAVLCVCCFAAIIATGAIGGIGAFGVTQPVADVGEKFMQALKSGDYDTAYGLTHPSLQQKLGSAQGLKRLVENGKAEPVTWNFTSRRIENDEGIMEGTVKMRGGEGTVKLEFVQVSGAWKVIAFDLEAN